MGKYWRLSKMARKQGRPKGIQYPEKITITITTDMRTVIDEIKSKKGFFTEMETLRYLLEKGIKEVMK